MKRCLKVIIIIFFIWGASLHTYAQGIDSLSSDMDSLYDEIPADFYELTELRTDDINGIDSALSLSNILKIFMNVLKNALLKYKGAYSSVFVLTVAVFIYEAVGKSFGGKVAELADISVILVFALSLFDLTVEVVNNFISSYESISGYTASVSAVTLTAMVSTGSGASAASFGTFCSFFVNAFNYICSAVVIPYIYIYLSVALCGSVTGDFDLRRVSSFIRNTSVGLIGGFITLFGSLMSVQSVISMNRDTMLKKTVKQLLSSGLPVLGGAVSDGIDTLFTTAAGIKNHAGSVGIIVSVVLSVAPIAELIVIFIFLSVVCFILSFFEGVKLCDFITTVRDMFSVLICVSLALSIMTVLLFYFIIKVT